VVPLGPNVNEFEASLERFVNDENEDENCRLNRKVVALYGMPYNIDRIMEIADRYGIKTLRVFSSSLQAIA